MVILFLIQSFSARNSGWSLFAIPMFQNHSRISSVKIFSHVQSGVIGGADILQASREIMAMANAGDDDVAAVNAVVLHLHTSRSCQEHAPVEVHAGQPNGHVLGRLWA